MGIGIVAWLDATEGHGPIGVANGSAEIGSADVAVRVPAENRRAG